MVATAVLIRIVMILVSVSFMSIVVIVFYVFFSLFLSQVDLSFLGCFVMGRRRCATIAQDNINQVDCSTGNTCVINADCGAGESCGLFRLDNCSPATKVIGGTCLDL